MTLALEPDVDRLRRRGTVCALLAAGMFVLGWVVLFSVQKPFKVLPWVAAVFRANDAMARWAGETAT